MKHFFLNSNGQIAVMLAIIFPLFILLLAFFVNMGVLIHQKIRMQNAVDVGVYSATASLARDLNKIARHNVNIDLLYQGSGGDLANEEVSWVGSFVDQVRDKSFNNEAMAINHFTQYQDLYTEIYQKIDRIRKEALAKADSIGAEAARLTYYNGNSTSGGSFTFERQNQFPVPEDDGQEVMITLKPNAILEAASYIKGNPLDPTGGYCQDCYKRFINLPLTKTSKVEYAAKVSANTGFTNLLPNFFRVSGEHYKGSSQIGLETYAAGQPYSGQVESGRATYRASLIRLNDVLDGDEYEY